MSKQRTPLHAMLFGALMIGLVGGALLFALGAFVLPYSAHETLVKVYVYVFVLPYASLCCVKFGQDAVAGFRAGTPTGRSNGISSTIGFFILLFLLGSGVFSLLTRGF